MKKPLSSVSDRDAEILHVLQRSSNLSIDEISRIVSIPQHIVRRSIQRLLDGGLIIPYAPIQTAALGFTEYQVILNWNGQQVHELSALMQKVLRHEHVPFVCESVGELSFTVWARTASEFGEILDELMAECPASISKVVAFRRWFLSLGVVVGARRESPGYRLGPCKVPQVIDTVDHQILKAISATNSHNAREIARLAGVPASTAMYRIKKLLDSEVILEPRYLIDVGRLGRTRLRIRLETTSASAFRTKVIDAARATPEAMMLCELVGPWDFEVTLAPDDETEANEIVASFVDKIGGGVQRISIGVHCATRKIRNYPFQVFKG